MSKLLSNVMNYYAVLAIYKFEMARMRRTLLQSIVTPVLTTSLYFIVLARQSAHAFKRWVASAMVRLLSPGLLC